jgi:hypothetical protein
MLVSILDDGVSLSNACPSLELVGPYRWVIEILPFLTVQPPTFPYLVSNLPLTAHRQSMWAMPLGPKVQAQVEACARACASEVG